MDKSKPHPFIYSLALGVHCTSWAFFGTTTQATQYGWAFVPTYLGVIFVMLFGFTVVKKIARLSQQHNVSSLADFIGMQYQHSILLTTSVTILCFFGVVPYVALQLDSVVDGLKLLTNESSTNMGLYVAMTLAILAIFLGARSFELVGKKPGLMLTIAFASLLKLITLVSVGLYVCYVVFDGVFDLLGQAQTNPAANTIIKAEPAVWVYLSHVLLGICAMFCLPRQFHVNFVENKSDTELHTARWLLPAYLVMMTAFVLPIGIAGHILFSEQQVSTDSYALAIPLFANQTGIALASFIGGLAAATSMVVVACLAVGIMISNNLVTPLWLKMRIVNQRQDALTPKVILWIRRITIASVLAVSYLYHRDVSSGTPLVNSGIIAMALLAQTLPMMLLGLYWSRANRYAALLGLFVGATGWLIWLLWPSITSSYYFDPKPTDLDLGKGFVFSLLANICCYAIVAMVLAYKNKNVASPTDSVTNNSVRVIKIDRLLALTQNVLSEKERQSLNIQPALLSSQSYASLALINDIENALASKIGGASARILISAISEQDQVPLPELVGWMEEATQTFQFNHEILQSSVQHIHQGISVIDPDLKLIAWNQRYIELFDYPADFIKAGLSMRELLEFNAKRGLLGGKQDSPQEIEKRIDYIRQGSLYKHVRKQPNGKVIELNGSPLPGGGYVTTYSDISEYIRIQDQLEQAKSQLELRVAQRTKELNQSNQALSIAKLQAEQANDSKTKFLAAAGHDLMQPFNAASLFGEMIQQKSTDPEIKQLSQSLNDSLVSAEELLSLLLDMTKLESGVLQTHVQDFCIDEVLSGLANEFAIIAEQKGIELHYVKSSLSVRSDKTLLRRIVQNLLSNAVRYTQQGKIVLGCKRQAGSLKISVLDTGLGISNQDQKHIFEEFKQLGEQHTSIGLGLGLTIVDKLASLLDHPITVKSQLGKGSHFSIQVPIVKSIKTAVHFKKEMALNQLILQGKTILLAENDPQTCEAVSQLLTSWGALVISITRVEEIEEKIRDVNIDLMILDYHLDENQTGIDIANEVRRVVSLQRGRQNNAQSTIIGILNSSDRSDEIRTQALENELLFLPKPLKSAALKRMLRQSKVVSQD
ncbi:PAS domain-containing hybrid sensor histidine kinase/response regulator [Aliiglaciecola litoralis]|uniref:histidine kinase n=1 Tax=Aliiglaciecola litoralis TaxID=582857 RepID=A0ABN1LD55_9ALTE